MSTPLALGKIGQIARTVKDIGRAQQWYGKVLGLTHLYTFGKLIFRLRRHAIVVDPERTGGLD